jgi:hypothetical protein
VIFVAFATFAAATFLAWRAFSSPGRVVPTGDGRVTPTITLERDAATGETSATLSVGEQAQVGRFINVRTFGEAEKVGFETRELLPEQGLPGHVEIHRGAAIEVVGAEELRVGWISALVFEGDADERGYIVAGAHATLLDDRPDAWQLTVDAEPRPDLDLPPLMPGRVGLLLLGRWPGGEPLGVLFGLDVTEPPSDT